MGSRVMHYCISTTLKKELQINDDQFLMGSLAPDVYESKSELKERSHFMKKDDSGLEFVDYNSFYKKYMDKSKIPFHLGYYFHLISDDIWLKEIYYKKIKWLPQNIKTEAKRKYYRDFRRLNDMIINHYSLELLPLEIQPIDIDEIDNTLLAEQIRFLNSDFNISDSTKGDPLEILIFSEVIQTIEKTVAICLAKVEDGIEIR